MNVSRDSSDSITVTVPYDPQLVEKVKTIEGRKWHRDKKYWSFPNTDGTLEKILNVFKGEEIHLDPALRNIITISAFRQKQSPAEKRHSELVSESHASRITHHDFEDLRRELLSRKYSYKTVKSYLYFNRDFLNFIGKKPFEITESDIKNYLVYLAEENNQQPQH